MPKIIRIEDKVVILFEDGTYYEKIGVSKELFDALTKATTKEEIYKIICPDYADKLNEYNDNINLLESIKSSFILTIKGNSVYWEDVSSLSLPFEFAKEVIKAEKNDDTTKLIAYKNFWTLMSLNPNEECRRNLFWFLNKWGLKISKCGFFVAYRNAEPIAVDGEGNQIYTDMHSHSTRIKIGEVVTMPREKCDCDSSVSCSRGLHAAGAGWLEKNYYGSQGLVVLVNPADVTAVP
jgi:hypothetical protein